MAGVPEIETAIFAFGCFWGAEQLFAENFTPEKGVLKTIVGYTGGSVKQPRDEQVSSGTTGHAKAVRVVFDTTIVSYAELVEFFYRSHDPTTLNRQGGDLGSEYRSVLFYDSREQAATARRVTQEVQAKHFTPQNKSIITEIKKAGPWWDAGAAHQQYLARNPTGYRCSTHRLHW
ncbi:peptide methionine sulfoxide reductase [Mycena crocata]|nr:peptide methionine sulfoxide reductase [Mycena crocata]